MSEELPPQPSNSHEIVEHLMTIAQVSKILGVSRPTIYELIYKQGLPVIRLGKALRFLPSSLQRWIALQETV